VLRSFSKSREIFYTAATYTGADASGAVFAQEPADLVSHAPSVTIASGFRGSTLAAVLSVPLERLCRHSHDGHVQPQEQAFAAPETVIDAAADRAEGEDGYGLADTESSQALYAAEPSWSQSQYGQDDDYDDGFGGAISAATMHYGGYSDNGETEDEAYGTVASAEESRFPEGAAAPPMLEDSDDQTSDVDQAAAYSDGYESDAAGFDALDYARTPESIVTPAARQLTIEAKRALIAAVAPFESGQEGYAAIIADGEFQGQFPGHPAQGRYHIGLSYGIVRFTQDSGNLGRLLLMMRLRAPEKFRQVFGSNNDELIHVTNLPGPASSQVQGGRSARVQPIGGSDLWEPVWVARFREAARADLFGSERQLFNGAQNELAAMTYLDPMLAFAGWLGLNSERALAIVLDRSVQMGPFAARRWMVEAAGPVQTIAQRQQALSAVGYPDLPAFQKATPGLDPTGEWEPNTHAALVARLRSLGPGRSPLPLPGADEMLQAMIRRAAGTPWENRTRQLYNGLSDTTYQI
jgi:hypothetical protein